MKDCTNAVETTQVEEHKIFFAPLLHGLTDVNEDGLHVFNCNVLLCDPEKCLFTQSDPEFICPNSQNVGCLIGQLQRLADNMQKFEGFSIEITDVNEGFVYVDPNLEYIAINKNLPGYDIAFLIRQIITFMNKLKEHCLQ